MACAAWNQMQAGVPNGTAGLTELLAHAATWRWRMRLSWDNAPSTMPPTEMLSVAALSVVRPTPSLCTIEPVLVPGSLHLGPVLINQPRLFSVQARVVLLHPPPPLLFLYPAPMWESSSLLFAPKLRLLIYQHCCPAISSPSPFMAAC